MKPTVVDHLAMALECSIYAAPLEHGLTQQELFEVGRRLDFKDGEIGDAIPKASGPIYFGQSRLQPRDAWHWDDFNFVEDPDLRSIEAFEAIHVEMRELLRSVGKAKAAIDRAVLIERAVGRGAAANDAEVAVSILLMSECLLLENGLIRYKPGRESWPLPSEQRNQAGNYPPQPKPLRAKVWPVVRDVVRRRSDGRAQQAEPLDAFAPALEAIGYGGFRAWWLQTVGELRRAETSHAPLTVTVLAAALVEGALTFAAKHAKKLQLAVFASTDFDREPRTWKIDDLVKSACGGRDAAVFDESLRRRADELIRTRQRIHAGRMLSDHATGVPDLRPEEARDAKATADAVVRAVLDWIARHPQP